MQYEGEFYSFLRMSAGRFAIARAVGMTLATTETPLSNAMLERTIVGSLGSVLYRIDDTRCPSKNAPKVPNAKPPIIARKAGPAMCFS